MAYTDLSVVYSGSTLESRVQAAMKLGFEVIAIDYNKYEVKKIAKHEKDPLIPTDKIKLDSATIDRLKVGRQPFKQLARITIEITDPAMFHKLSLPGIQQYDIVAVKPTSEKILFLVCDSPFVDLVVIDTTQKLPYSIKHGAVSLALQRGIHFEVQYSAAIRDNTMKRNLICNAQKLIQCCKGKNVIISSGCEKAMEIRGPHDVANLGLLFGMTDSQAKAAVGKNCRAVLCHAEERKLAKTTVGAVKSSDISKEQEWVLKRQRDIQNRIESLGEPDTKKQKQENSS